MTNLRALSLFIYFPRYKSLSETIAKKFTKKRKRAEVDESLNKEIPSISVEEETSKGKKKKASKKKFLKPKDE